jgi:uncharacterized integral membrane protein
MNGVRETIILEMDNIRITNIRAFIGWKTYELADIRSVSLTEKNGSPTAGKASMIVSLICLVIGILSCVAALSIRFISITQDFSGLPQIIVHLLFAVIGLIFIYLGSIGWESDKPTYIVQIETPSGTSRALETKDKKYVERIIKAINDAIARQD